MTRAALDIMYDSLCAALRHSLSEGSLGLTASLRFANGAEIAQAAERLTNSEILALFLWLDDTRAKAMLETLPMPVAEYILNHAPSGRIAVLSAQQTDLPHA